jgi:hypothetical protein
VSDTTPRPWDEVTLSRGVAYPLPRLADDPRFTHGLSSAVAKVLEQHGYPEITEGMDLLRLQGALFGFLYEEAGGEHAD